MRAVTASSVKERMAVCQEKCVIVHWDGKILPDTTGECLMVDRLPIHITGTDIPKKGESAQLLGVPRLTEGGTGRAQADAVISVLRDWNLESSVVGLCFDTTASNTGSSEGCCVLLERHLGKEVL